MSSKYILLFWTHAVCCILFSLQRLRALVNPTIDWGPALVEHRRLVDYVDGWVVDPSNPTDMQLGSYSVRNLTLKIIETSYSLHKAITHCDFWLPINRPYSFNSVVLSFLQVLERRKPFKSLRETMCHTLGFGIVFTYSLASLTRRCFEVRNNGGCVEWILDVSPLSDWLFIHNIFLFRIQVKTQDMKRR